jgi:hypothetical protein
MGKTAVMESLPWRNIAGETEGKIGAGEGLEIVVQGDGEVALALRWWRGAGSGVVWIAVGVTIGEKWRVGGTNREVVVFQDKLTTCASATPTS